MTCQDRIKAQQDRVKLLSGDERGHIVRQLKAKWDSVNEQYVKPSMKTTKHVYMTSVLLMASDGWFCALLLYGRYQKSSTLDLKKLDTMGKVRRKEQYEAELQQLESYIDRLSSKRHVFVTS